MAFLCPYFEGVEFQSVVHGIFVLLSFSVVVYLYVHIFVYMLFTIKLRDMREFDLSMVSKWETRENNIRTAMALGNGLKNKEIELKKYNESPPLVLYFQAWKRPWIHAGSWQSTL